MKHFEGIKLAVCVALIFFTVTVKAQQTAEKYVVETGYLLYLPDGYHSDTTSRWPVMMFLHGVGECGDDLNKVKLLGPPAMIEQGHKFPFIVVSPQSPRPGWDTEKIKDLVEYINDNLRTDRDRFYLTGLSMGGYGTWNTAMNYPNLFAAIIPICGGGYPAMGYRITMPVWAFHGDADDIVDISESRAMVDAVSENNDRVKFTVYPGIGHDSWTETYNNPEVYQWMLAQKRELFKQVEMDPAALREYEGKFISEDFSISLTLEDGSLIMEVERVGKIGQLLAAGNDKFFTNPNDITTYYVFERNGDGIIESLKWASSNHIVAVLTKVD